jgi:CheY-like chemotaxis protein
MLAMELIYIIEDNSFLRINIQSLLEVHGYEVRSFEGGEEAIVALREAPAAMVLCDILMPGISGLDVLRFVRGLPEGDLIQFVVLSALAESDQMREAMLLGADDFVPKPFQNSALIETVRVRLSRRERDLARLESRERRGMDVVFDLLLGNSAMQRDGMHGEVEAFFRDGLANFHKGRDGTSERLGLYFRLVAGTHRPSPIEVVEIGEVISRVVRGAAHRARIPYCAEEFPILQLQRIRSGIAATDLELLLDEVLMIVMSAPAVGRTIRITCNESQSHAYLGIECSYPEMKTNDPAGMVPTSYIPAFGERSGQPVLGHALCVRLAELHGWEFRVGPDAGRGAGREGLEDVWDWPPAESGSACMTVALKLAIIR